MKLHHTVNHIHVKEIAQSVEIGGLIPQVADTYRDLVPEEIRHLPVVWLSEGIWQSKELPCFEVDAENLDSDKLFRNNVVYEVDKTLNWWVYQGLIPSENLTRIHRLI